MHILRETRRLGTAGSLSLLPVKIDTPLLVINGDVITKADFSALKNFHDHHNHDATLAVATYEFQIPFGVVRYSSDGIFDNIDEKPHVRHFVAAGIYYLAPEFLSLIPPDQPMDMPELLNLGRNVGLQVGLFPIHEYWIDVGRPTDLEAADRRPAETVLEAL